MFLLTGSFRGSTICWYDGNEFMSFPLDKNQNLVELRFITEGVHPRPMSPHLLDSLPNQSVMPPDELLMSIDPLMSID